MVKILDELDALKKRAEAQRLTIRKGNRPLPRTSKMKVVLDSLPTPSLPMNWYRPEWYDGLNTFQQGDLVSGDPEDLPDIVWSFPLPSLPR